MFVLQLPHDHNLTPWNQIRSLALAKLCPSDLIPAVANGTEFWVYWTLLLEALAALLQWCMCNYVRWIISFGRILSCAWPRYNLPRRGCPFPLLPVLTPTHCFTRLSMFQDFLLNWNTSTRCVCFPIDTSLFPAIAKLPSFQSRQGYSPGGTADFLISAEALSRKAYTCLHPDTSSEIRRTALCTIRSN